MKSLLISLFALLIALTAYTIFQHYNLSQAEAQTTAAQKKATDLEAKNTDLENRLAQALEESKSLKQQAAEVFRLRNEVTTLRKEQATMQQQLKAAEQRAARKETAAPEPKPENSQLPTQFANLEQMTQTVASLRSKAFGGGGLSEQEKQYLQQLKPQIEQLEKSPADFAAFQSGLIQSATGINDPARLQQIKEVIQKVYENANNRGLDVTSRPQDDAAWKQQRFQLDRRGTGAVQNILTESERAAFDKSFLGIMGVDLGTGVDKTLYPDGFLGETKVNR